MAVNKKCFGGKKRYFNKRGRGQQRFDTLIVLFIMFHAGQTADIGIGLSFVTGYPVGYCLADLPVRNSCGIFHYMHKCIGF